MIAATRLTKAAAVALVLGFGVARPCLADPYSLGSLANFAVYGFGAGTTIQLTGPASINGNVGVGLGSDLTLGGAGLNVSGKIFFANPIVVSGAGDNFNASGGPITINGQPACNSDATCSDASRAEGSNLVASQAQGDQFFLYNEAGLLAATTGSPTGTLNSLFTWTGNGGTNVARLASIDLSTGDVLTLNGTASDFFIFNIVGAMTGSSNGAIVLGANVSPDHVLFNLLCDPIHIGICDDDIVQDGTGDPVSFSGSFAGAGIVTALDRDITLTSTNA